MLSDLQKKKFTRFFRIFDYNGSGTIEASDFDAHGKSVIESQNIPAGSDQAKRVTAFFKDAWTSYWEPIADNGKVTLDKYLETLDQVVDKMPPDIASAGDKSLKSFFEMVDTNQDGKISIQEYAAFYRTPNEEWSDKIFKRLDLNGDGFLTIDEVRKLRDQFLADDANAPGNVLFGDI